jgi:amino acid permease
VRGVVRYALMRNQRTLAAIVAILIGLAALAVGLIYLTVEAKSLPSIMGQLHGATGHRSIRGFTAVIVGVALIAGGGGLFAYQPRSSG